MGRRKKRWVKVTFLLSSLAGLLGAGALTFYYFAAKAEANEPGKQLKTNHNLPLIQVTAPISQLTSETQYEKDFLQGQRQRALKQKTAKREIANLDGTKPASNGPAAQKKTVSKVNDTHQKPKNDSKPQPNLTGPVNGGGKTVYLTFDDGPESFSGDILTLLEKYHFKATFFMLDGNIKQHPAAVKKMVQLGEGVGLHGVTHNVKKFYASEQSILGEMEQDQETLKSITGVKTFLIRTPYGSAPYMTKEYKQAVADHGFLMWDWSIDSRDWYYRDDRFVTSIIAQLKQQTGHHPIVILMHEQKQTLDNLPKLLDYLTKQHYECKPLSDNMPPYHF